MNLNATLFIQILCFIAFIWVTMRFIWPPMIKAMEERRTKIADGLAAAEQGQKDLELAQYKSQEMLTEAKTHAAQIVEHANQRAHRIVEEAKTAAREEGERLLKMARNEIDQEYNSAKEKLIKNVSEIAVAGAEKILQREIGRASNDQLIDQLVSEI